MAFPQPRGLGFGTVGCGMTRAMLPRKPHVNMRISNSTGTVYELFSEIGLEGKVTFGVTR